MDNIETCIHCGTDSSLTDKLNQVGPVGANTLLEYAQKLGLQNLSNQIEQKQKNAKKINIHISCRTKLKNSSRKKLDDVQGPLDKKICQRLSWASTGNFNQQCLYCEKPC